MANEIISEIILDLDSMKAKLKEAEKLGADTGTRVGSDVSSGMEKGLESGFSAARAAIAGLAAALGTAFAVDKIITAAEEQDSATARFAGSLRSIGALTPQAVKSFEDYATSLQKVTTVADEVITSNAALLVSVGHLTGDGLKQATKAALDLAAGMNMDVGSAFNIVAKAAEGHVAVLGRYGIHLKETGDKAVDFKNAMNALAGAFGGQAEAQAQTFAGAMRQLHNAFGDVLEEMGKIIVNNGSFIKAISGLKSVFESLSKWVETNKDALIEWTGEALGYAIQVMADFIQVAGWLGEKIGPYLSGAIGLGKAAILGLEVAILSVGSTIEGFILKMQGMSQSDIDNKLIGTTEQINALKDALTANTASTGENILAYDGLAERAATMANTVRAFSQEVIDSAVATGPVIYDGLTKPVMQVPSVYAQILANVKGQLIQWADTVKMISAAVTASIQTFSNGLSKGFAQVGANLVNGASAFHDFGKIMLGVLGDIALQFGATFMLMGIGKVLLGDPTGAALIGAGVALSILGGALKAMAGGAGGGAPTPSAAGAGGAGGGISGGGISQTETGNTELAQEDKKPQTVVQVTVQGNILDRRATGLELVEIINESFGTSGTQTVATA